ncbi:MAG: hypothetical protein P9L99_19870 [Candidatus Lernaella stagnicola]|nr:hypothetical protein [Candidatus Lernaella stagnicola]
MGHDIRKWVEQYVTLAENGELPRSSAAKMEHYLSSGTTNRGGYGEKGRKEARLARILEIGRVVEYVLPGERERHVYYSFVREGGAIDIVQRARRVGKSAAYRWVSKIEAKIINHLWRIRRIDANRT